MSGGIIHRHVLPGKWSDDVKAMERVRDLVERTLRCLEILNGPAYFQIMIDREGSPYLIEVTPRLDGCHMWNVIKEYCGVDLLDACFRQLAGETPDLKGHEPEEGKSYKLKFFCQPPWTKFERANHSDEGSVYSFFYYEDGDKVRRLNGYIEKCGYAIYKE